MNTTPLVSIVIPALDPKNFSRALNSAVGQNYPALDVVVCDDSLGDEIRQAVEAVRVKLPANVTLRHVVNAKALGLNATVNECVKHARGEFIKVLFDEDWLMPEHTPLLVDVLVRNPDISIASSQRYLSDPSNRIMPNRMENSGFIAGDTRFKGSDLLSMFEVWPVNFIGGLSNVLMRRADVARLIPALTVSEAPFEVFLDLMLYCCLLCQGDVGIVDKYLAVERLKPLRLAAIPDPEAVRETEYQAMVQFLSGRDGERAEKIGGVRHRGLDAAVTQWEEVGLGRMFGVQADTMFEQVGVNCDNYDAVYEQWLQCRDFTPAQLQQLPARVEGWPRQAKIIPVIIDHLGDGSLQATLDSLAAQTWSAEAVLVMSATVSEPAIVGNTLTMPLDRDWPRQLNSMLRELDGYDWFCLLRAGDELTAHALLLLAERIAERDSMQACYWDEDALETDGHRAPVFRPDFNLDMLRSYPYVGRGLAFSREAFIEHDGFATDLLELSPHDLIFRLVEKRGPHAIEHIGEVLMHARQHFPSWLGESSVREGNAAMVARHLQRLALDVDITPGVIRLINRIHYRHPGQPLVSVVVASQGRLRGLQDCLESLLERTAYTQFEVLIVSAADEPAEVRDWLQAMAQIGGAKLRVVAAPAASNLSALVNLGAVQARGDYLLTLSQDCVVLDAGWLDEMLAHGRRHEVGVVGARLQAPDGSVEHAGLVLGLRGAVGSVFVGEPAGAAGYLHRLQVVQNYSAVSQQCLLIEKALFTQLNGLEEGDLAHGFADVDLCLRAGQQGYLVVWTPYAALMVRRQEQAPDSNALVDWRQCQRAAFNRWLPKLARDPAYNKNLSLMGASFTMNVGLRNGWQPFARHALPFVLGLPINKGAVGHYRLIQPLAELERAGLASSVINFGTPSILEIERIVPDTIVFQGRYSAGPVDGIAQVKEFSKAFRIFELDDYLLDVPAQNEHRRYLHRDIRETLQRGVGLCDRLVVSTDSLADAMSSMHNDIVVVPNMLPPERWRHLTSQRRAGKKPRVGWGGGTSHTGDLLLIKDVVMALADEVEWVFLGMCPEELRPYVHEYHTAVPLELYPQKMASLNLDLALAPLEQHIFNDCKSNLRLLEYGACGYPVVCTDTRSYRGDFPVTRVLTNSTHEWLEAIRMHLSDLDASARMGDQLREAVQRDFMFHGPALSRWLKAWMPS
ncbi:group 2 family glycosyltransferase [Pseudomonas sp. M47T1]|uniref:glycosyltransferase n=1 Tax=Pseudomonas sp. M47T1 TaxID=1179778 RepID=UPI000260815C|nr:glycosyltransferase [Pseudomonas sp. M47T1]EIK93158.1 group 2 family glycosyltransferase [Pseudomonas sp. M47T1]